MPVSIVSFKSLSLFGIFSAAMIASTSRTIARQPIAIAETLMLYSVWLVFSGSLSQVRLGWDVEAPVTGWSMAWLPIAGVVFAVSAALLHALKLAKLATGKLREDELVTVQESEDLAHVQAQEPAK